MRDDTGPIRLTGGEAALLTALARKANEVLSREEIAEALQMDDSGERAVDVQVVRLRRKIEVDPKEPRFLHTVRGRGYILKPGRLACASGVPFGRRLKRYMPQSLLGRTLLIMLVPLVIVQAVALQIFYGSHLGLVSRRLSSSIAGEIAYTMELMSRLREPGGPEL